MTGTRADYGKLKPLMRVLETDDKFDVFIYVCGMHLSPEFGSTYKEVLEDGYANVHVAFDLNQSSDASANLGNTVLRLSQYAKAVKPDMIIVHGDRTDALAGAIVGVLQNIMVAHIEGGEVSGTIDESIRHAVSKFAHVHFACTEEARRRLVQLGEASERIYVIGSPDIDIMMSQKLPTFEDAKKRYRVDFDSYGILIYHPVTTEIESLPSKIRNVVDAIIESNKNYIVIKPNNDLGHEIILHEYERFDSLRKIKVFSSIRFEHFLALLKNAEFVVGNSSAGIREAGVYGIPTIDIGTRQSGRCRQTDSNNIVHADENTEQITALIQSIKRHTSISHAFGNGDSAKQFHNIVSSDAFWNTDLQKSFVDLDA